jgi:[glutamine synthetase] adenylyltransferase / [glutamine synthetase]-adenylyl-L-tyrosine phosphorylase
MTKTSVAERVKASGHSRMVQRIRRRYATLLPLLPPGHPVRSSMQIALDRLLASGLDVGAGLRVLRQLVVERLAVLDCDGDEDGRASLGVVTTGMTELAELALDVALEESNTLLDALHGPPRTALGERARLWVVGMGKLGARELNVSSDIDLIYVYDHDGETAGRPDGRGQISNHEYFAQQVKVIFGLIGDVTEHGFVFRVDLALRPNGNSGPAAVSLSALEDYFQAHGREWERFAWLKSRVVAPQECIREKSVQGLRGAVLPFVFRRYLDYNVFDALRILHRQIRQQATKRCAGHPERANDVKLSRGGIREIEFTVQLLQVVRGGQFPELRTRPTLDALARVAKAGLMRPETADGLMQAYQFLRRVEHRIQYLDDQQTHVLPTQDDDIAWIAATMGLRNTSALLEQLDTHRELVAGEFDRLLGGTEECRNCIRALGSSAAQHDALQLDDLVEQLSEQWPVHFRDRLALWRSHPRLLALRDESRARLTRLVRRTAVWLLEGTITEDAAIRIVDWIEPLLRRESYLALLLERPAVHERLLRLLGAAKWPARYLLQHPGVIDELASDDMLHERFDGESFRRELHARLASLTRTGEDDEETCLNLLRRAHHAEVFRTLARDVEGVLSVEQVADDLSALAEAVLAVTAEWCWQRLKIRHHTDGDKPQFGIIAYGKLGGKELGYGSDLDIVFVYDDEHDQAPVVYAAFVRKLIAWLTIKTGEGDLFEIDTALRPNGNSGLLVTSLDAYARYQQQRGSNTAWTWEHQAITRARFVLGPPAMQQRFDEVRRAVIMSPRDTEALKREIVAMRETVRAAHPEKMVPARPPNGTAADSGGALRVQSEKFDVKHTSGGMVDAEFVVQYLVLSSSAQHPELADNVGNIALLRLAERAGLVPPGIGERAAAAFRELRRVQHQARLNEEPTQVSPLTLQNERRAIQRLWLAVFGEAVLQPRPRNCLTSRDRP